MTRPPHLYLSGKLIAFRATELRHARPSNDADRVMALVLQTNDNPVLWA